MRSFISTCTSAVLTALVLTQAHAATIVVNSDGTPSSPGFADDGQCTLFEAVAAANDNAPSGTLPGECIAGEGGGVMDEIVFDPAMLPAVILMESELIIDEGLAINGPHRDLLTLQGLLTSRIMQFSNMRSDDDFELRGMTLSGGRASGQDTFDGSGGAIWTSHGGEGVSLTIERVRFEGNSARVFGGAIAIQLGIDGTTTIRESIFENNVTDGSALEISASGGGAIFIGAFQQVTIEDSTFVGNHADTIQNQDRRNGRGNDRGGDTDRGGGAIYILSQNPNADSTLDVFRSTFSENWTDGTGGAISVGDPAFFDDRSIVSVRHSTLTLNRADDDDDRPGGSGGAIYSTSQDGVTLFNSLIAQNEDESTDPAPNLAGSFNTLGHNYISTNQGVEGTFPAGLPNANNDFTTAADDLNSDGLLELADNGGPTSTHGLMGADPLTVDNGRCAQQSVDQRGASDPVTLLRPVDQPLIVNLFDGCDIGAFERDAEATALPHPVADIYSVAEDQVLIVDDVGGSLTPSADDDGILVNDSHPDGLPLVVVNAGTLSPTSSDMSSGGELELFADGTLVYTPPANESGRADAAPSEVSDGRNWAIAQLSVDVLPVNDAPTFTAATSTINASTSGVPVTVPGWASDIDAGAPDEVDQILTFEFTIVDGDPGLLAGAPSLDPATGDLEYEIVSGQTGFVLMDVVLVDDGGTDLGGIDASVPASLTIAFDSNPPDVTISAPPDGSSFDFGETVAFAADASDIEDGDLSASLSWQSDIDGVLGTGATLGVDTLSVGAHRVRARVVDSDGLPGRDFIELIVQPPRTPPIVEITAPSDGSTTSVGDPVTFAGTAQDAEDGDLSAILTWTSNRQGAIGSGASFSTAQLVAGAHVITASAVDSDGDEGTDEVNITVTENQDTYQLRLIKYNDVDQDGTNNELNLGGGDPPSGNALTGWEFTVYDDQTNLVAQGTTSVENPGATGDLGIRVSLPGLISGETYTICETQQTGWTNTEPGTLDPTYGQPCETVTLTSSTTVTRYFGNYIDNQPPVADAGPDQVVLDADDSGSELVVLDGTGSSDPDGTIASSDYVWTLDGEEIAVGASASFAFTVGVHDVVLIVTDDDGASDTDTARITVSAPDTIVLRIIKYNDIDQDGTNNELNLGGGDPPSGNALTGWEFTVYDDQTNLVAQGTTSVENPGANGDLGIRVSLPGLICDETYTICETQQAGWVNTQPGTIDPVYGEPCRTATLSGRSIVMGYFGNAFQGEIFRDRFQPIDPP